MRQGTPPKTEKRKTGIFWDGNQLGPVLPLAILHSPFTIHRARVLPLAIRHSPFTGRSADSGTGVLDYR